MTTIDHWLSLPWSLTLTLTNCLRFTLVFSTMPIQSRFLHTFWFLGLFFHRALTSLKFDHTSFWVHLSTKFTNSLTYSFHIGLDPRVGSTIHDIHPMQPFMDTFMYHSMHLRGIFPSLCSKLKTSSNLYLGFERVLKILIYYGLLCVMVQEVQYMEYSTLNSNNLLYTLEKNIRNKILVHFYGLCA